MLKVWNMTTGNEMEYECELLKWEAETNAERLDSHYDMILEKWYFYERRRIDNNTYIYQISYKE